ncbi:MAG: hypothetical protein WC523_01430 [Patescibacteria group bacterium]|jgi:hypothetical protein
MFPEQLKKILKLIKMTGDRVIIFDASFPQDSYVVMDLDRYAGMMGATNPSEKKIASNPGEKNQELPLDQQSKTEESGNLTEEDLTDKINREISMWKNRENLPYLAEEDKPKKAWQIPPQVKDKAQGVEG